MTVPGGGGAGAAGGGAGTGDVGGDVGQPARGAAGRTPGAVITGPIPVITGSIPVVGPSLHDEALEDEIELVSELVAAATESDEPLLPDEIDRVLGLG
ncbi:MAG TPA: hypothetical protein VF661_12800 [Actinomycetales bacterium]